MFKWKKSICLGAGNGIRTHEHLRDWTLNPAPLTWLGNPRKRCRHPHAVVVFNCIRTTLLAARPPSLSHASCLCLSLRHSFHGLLGKSGRSNTLQGQILDSVNPLAAKYPSLPGVEGGLARLRAQHPRAVPHAKESMQIESNLHRAFA